jgi:hypothetical protein
MHPCNCGCFGTRVVGLDLSPDELEPAGLPETTAPLDGSAFRDIEPCATAVFSGETFARARSPREIRIRAIRYGAQHCMDLLRALWFSRFCSFLLAEGSVLPVQSSLLSRNESR